MLKEVKEYIAVRLRGAIGMQGLENQLETIKGRLDKLCPEANNGKFTMELDYPPSYDYRPRWGNTHPVHGGLVDLFNRDRSEYAEIFKSIGEFKPYLSRITRNFKDAQKGEPAWLEVAINAVDSALLYYFMTALKPRTFLEIGSGVTTLFAGRAKRDHGLSTRIISIDPKPRAEVDAVCDEIIRAGLETMDLSVFSTLQKGDIVFFDGSHRSFMNSDVTVFMLDVLPSLSRGS